MVGDFLCNFDFRWWCNRLFCRQVRCNFTRQLHYTSSFFLFTFILHFIHPFSSLYCILSPLAPSLIAVEVESLMTPLLCASRRRRFSLQLLLRSKEPHGSYPLYDIKFCLGYKYSSFMVFDNCHIRWPCYHNPR
jgi:hypothetical protein